MLTPWQSVVIVLQTHTKNMQRFTVLTRQLLKIQQPLLNRSNIHNDDFQLIFHVDKPKIALQ